MIIWDLGGAPPQRAKKKNKKQQLNRCPHPNQALERAEFPLFFSVNWFRKTLLSCFLLSLASSAENAEHYVGNVARQNSPGPVLQHKAGQTVDVRGPECHVIQSSEEVLLELFHQKGGLGRVCGIELQGEARGVRHGTVCTVL